MSTKHPLVPILQSLFVIALIAITLVVIFPLQRELSERMEEFKQNLTQLFSETTGGSISFESIHPSILGFIEVRKLEIYGVDNTKILSLDRIILYYNISAILQGNFFNAPNSLQIRGANLLVNDSLLELEPLKPEDIALIETILNDLSDNFLIELVNCNFQIVSEESGLKLRSLISRGRVVLNSESLRFSLINASELSLSLPNNSLFPSTLMENSLFASILSENPLPEVLLTELHGQFLSEIDAQMNLPLSISLSEIQTESTVQLHLNLRDINTNIVDIADIDLYIGYADEAFNIQTLEENFAVNLRHNIAIPIQPDLVGTIPSTFNTDSSIEVNFVSNEWSPSELIQLKGNLEGINTYLESSLNANISVELSNTLFPVNTELFLETHTFVPVLDRMLSSVVQLHQQGSNINLREFDLRAEDNNVIHVWGNGDIIDRNFSLSGWVMNENIDPAPEFSSNFTVDIQSNMINAVLFDSKIFGAELISSNITTEIGGDEVLIDVLGTLSSGEGTIEGSTLISGVSHNSIQAQIDMSIFQIPLSDIIAVVGEVPYLQFDLQENALLPSDLEESVVEGSVEISIATGTSFFEGFSFTANNLTILNPRSGQSQLVANANFDQGILQETSIDIDYLGQIINVVVTGDLSNTQQLSLFLTAEVNTYPYSTEINIFPQENRLYLRNFTLNKKNEEDNEANGIIVNNSSDDLFKTSVANEILIELRSSRIDIDTRIERLDLPFLGESAWIDTVMSASLFTQNIINSSIDIQRLNLNDFDSLPGSGLSRISLSASGVIADSIEFSAFQYYDTVSTLNGNAEVLWNNNEFEIQMALSNDLENYTADARINLLENIINARLTLENFTSRRFGADELTGLFNANLEFESNENIIVSYDIQSVNTRLERELLFFQASGGFRDNILRVDSGYFEMDTIAFRDINALLNMSQGAIAAQSDLYFADLNRRKELFQRIDIALFAPELLGSVQVGSEYEIFDYLKNLEGQILLTFGLEEVEPEVWTIEVMEQNNAIELIGGPQYAANNLKGSISSFGDFAVTLDPPLPISFNAEGFLREGLIDLTLSNLEVQPSIINLSLDDIFNFQNGRINGSIRLEGSIIDPNFYGTVYAESVGLSVYVIPDQIITEEVVAILDGQNIYFPQANVLSGNDRALVNGGMVLDRWIPTSLNLSVLSSEGGIRIVNSFPFVDFDGWGSGSLDMSVNFLTGGFDITGDIVADSTHITVSNQGGGGQDSDQQNNTPINVNLKMRSGDNVVFYWPSRDFPVIRSFAEPGSELDFIFSNIQNSFSLRGDLLIGGGEIFYFDQDFNIRRGSIAFNENEQKQFEPIVNLEAEFRSTEQGRPIRINLEVIDDNIFQMQPLFSSNPLRSQEEIVLLLGGTLTGTDEGNNVAISSIIASGSQLIGQIGPLAEIESSIQQVLGLDLLSFRLGVVETLLESTLNSGVNSVPLTVGDYLNNTSLVVGNYLGEDGFFEGSVRIQKQNLITDTNVNELGIRFSPELRLEFNTPIFTIDWSWAFLDNLDTLSVTEHRITFSRSFAEFLP